MAEKCRRATDRKHRLRGVLYWIMFARQSAIQSCCDSVVATTSPQQTAAAYLNSGTKHFEFWKLERHALHPLQPQQPIGDSHFDRGKDTSKVVETIALHIQCWSWRTPCELCGCSYMVVMLHPTDFPATGSHQAQTTKATYLTKIPLSKHRWSTMSTTRLLSCTTEATLLATLVLL